MKLSNKQLIVTVLVALISVIVPVSVQYYYYSTHPAYVRVEGTACIGSFSCTTNCCVNEVLFTITSSQTVESYSASAMGATGIYGLELPSNNFYSVTLHTTDVNKPTCAGVIVNMSSGVVQTLWSDIVVNLQCGT